MAARFWTDDRDQSVRDMRRDGVRYKDIATRLGVSFGAVKKRVYELKLPGRKRPPPQTEWTDVLVERCKVLVAEGRKTREISEILGNGITRYAIIGKMQRIGFAFPKREKKEGRPRKSNVIRVNFRRTPVPPPVSVDPLNVTFANLEPGQCKYPTTPDAPFLFCGHPQAEIFTRSGTEKSSYCAFHHHLCWVPPHRRVPEKSTVRMGA